MSKAKRYDMTRRVFVSCTGAAAAAGGLSTPLAASLSLLSAMRVEAAQSNGMTTDVCEVDFPPASYGRTLEEVEVTIQQVVERVFRDDDGILRSGVNGRTMKPMRIEDVKDRPQGMGTFAENSAIPRAVKPIWLNYENAGQATGKYL